MTPASLGMWLRAVESTGADQVNAGRRFPLHAQQGFRSRQGRGVRWRGNGGFTARGLRRSVTPRLSGMRPCQEEIHDLVGGPAAAQPRSPGQPPPALRHRPTGHSDRSARRRPPGYAAAQSRRRARRARPSRPSWPSRRSPAAGSRPRWASSSGSSRTARLARPLPAVILSALGLGGVALVGLCATAPAEKLQKAVAKEFAAKRDKKTIKPNVRKGSLSRSILTSGGVLICTPLFSIELELPLLRLSARVLAAPA